jgi:hypothetical protein
VVLKVVSSYLKGIEVHSDILEMTSRALATDSDADANLALTTIERLVEVLSECLE